MLKYKGVFEKFKLFAVSGSGAELEGGGPCYDLELEVVRSQ